MSKHKTTEQRMEEKVKKLTAELSKKRATNVRNTMQLEILQQLTSALSEQSNILARMTFLVEQGKKDFPEYLDLDRRSHFLEDFINEHKYLNNQIDNS